MPRLEKYPRLLHLFLLDRHTYNRYKARIAELGLPARLHSISFGCTGEAVLQHAWPQLRSLNVVYSVDALLDTMLADPTLVFPKLEALSVLNLRAETVTKLNALLDRGVFPSLTTLALGPWWDAVQIKSSGDAFKQACDLLRRLPNTHSLQLGAALGIPSHWGYPLSSCSAAVGFPC